MRARRNSPAPGIEIGSIDLNGDTGGPGTGSRARSVPRYLLGNQHLILGCYGFEPEHPLNARDLAGLPAAGDAWER